MKHLIHIGFPKAASSTLQFWFSQHPELKYQEGAIAGFYNAYELCHHAAGKEKNDYKYLVTSSESFVAPLLSTGNYPLMNGYGFDSNKHPFRMDHSQEKMCELLRVLYPQSATILLVTRGFKSLFLSRFSQYLKEGGVFSFENWLDLQAKIFNSHTIYALDYDRIYYLYAQTFGEENIIVLPYELLREDSQKFLSIIEVRLELQKTDIQIQRINKSLSKDELYWYPRISFRIAKLAKKLGPAGYATFYKWYIRQTRKQKIKFLATFLSYFRESESINEDRLPPSLLEPLKDKATIFKQHPCYQKYLVEYLQDI